MEWQDTIVGGLVGIIGGGAGVVLSGSSFTSHQISDEPIQIPVRTHAGETAFVAQAEAADVPIPFGLEQTDGTTENTSLSATEQVADSEAIQVNAVGVEQNVMLADGTMTNLGYAEVNGCATVFVDADQDGTFDFAVVDVNHNTVMDANEVFTVPADMELTVGMFLQEMTAVADDALMAQGNDLQPDYSNDADTFSYA